MNDFFYPFLIFYLVFLMHFPIRCLKYSRKRVQKHFDGDKLRRFQNKRKKWALIFTLSIIIIIYTSYNVTFTVFVILAWISLFISSLMTIYAQGSIMEQNKNKKWIIKFINENYKKGLLELAREIEYPYSVLKQIYDYLEKKGEIIT